MDKKTILLANRCRFHLGDIPDAWQAWYDDSEWEDVTLPHDWSVGLPFSREYSSGTGYLAGGIGWYRIHISPKEEWKGKRISVCFDGVYKNSRVWCNSYYLGERPNGYISFSYDITDQFSFERDNIISVYVDRREVADSRWFTGSGITRKVTLLIEEAVHPVPNGVFFSTPSVGEESADYTVENTLINTLDEAAAVTVTNSLYDSAGTLISSAEATGEIAPKETLSLTAKGVVSNPKLWSTEAPYLYTLETVVSFKTSATVVTELCDRRKVGIRSFRFDADKGFFLNEVPTTFKGVCVHHDAGCLGAAVFKSVWARRLEKLKAMGCNAIRMSHNPHMPELFDLCDAMGFMVIDEAFDEWEGPKNKWSTGHNVYPPKHQGYYVDFPTWHEKDLVDLILRDRNHPSIIMWSIGNEIDYPNDPYCHPSFTTMTGNNDANKPAQERQYNPERPNAERLSVLAKHLVSIVKKTDTTHPVTLAAAFPELSAKLGFIDDLDVTGYNYKEHLYEESHKNFPSMPFLGSENGHTLKAWKAVTENEYISGQFLWTGIDYLGEAHGWPIHGSGAGLLTLAGFEKPGYYRRQSFWATKPVIYLATTYADAPEGEFAPVSPTWNYLDDQEVLIKCYTNVSKVELFLNEKSLGVYDKASDEDCISLILPFEPGVLTAIECPEPEEIPSDDWEPATCSIRTTGATCQIHLKLWKPHISYQTDCNLTGEALPYQIEVSMLDRDGNRDYTNSTCLFAKVENGELLGMENGDLSDVTDYSAPFRRAYHGELLVYIVPLSKSEPVTLTLSGDGLQPVSCTITSHIED